MAATSVSRWGALAGLLAFAGARAATADTVIPGGNLGNQTWTAAGSPYVIEGDATVQSGATLTVQPGTIVEVAATDALAGGASTSQVELIVHGTLAVNGSLAMPVAFRAQTGTAASSWYGIRVLSDAPAATITNAVIQHATAAVTTQMTTSPLVVKQVTLNGNANGIVVIAGTATISELTATENDAAIQFTGGGGSVTNALIAVPARFIATGIMMQGSTAPVRIVNCTIDGMYTAVGTQTDQPTEVVNSIATNGVNGFYADSGVGLLTVTSSDAWNNTVDLHDTAGGAGVISADPRYASATDWHLRAPSPCIDSGSATGAPDHDLDLVARPQGSASDMGAYESPGGASGGAGGAGGVGGGGASAGAGGHGGLAGSGSAGAGGGAGSTGPSGAAGSAGAGGGAGSTGPSGATGSASAGGAAGNAGPGTAGAGGRAGGAGGRGAAGGGGAGARPSPGDETGCGCRLTGEASPRSLLILALAIGLCLLRARPASGRRRT